MNLLDTKTSDPFSKIDDQDVLTALDGQKSCSDVVTIFGRAASPAPNRRRDGRGRPVAWR